MAALSYALNKPPGSCYLPGESLNGTLTVDIQGRPFDCEFLDLTLEGKGKVEITHRRSYLEEETYLSSVIPLLRRTTIPPGRTVFPFHYVLPVCNLPCSIEDSNGSIRYTITANLRGPNFENDTAEMVPFIVGPHLDLNTVPLRDFALTEFDECKDVGCCCSSELVKVHFSFPKRFFIPGELIRFKVTTQNESGATLLKTSVKLVLTITCRVDGGYKESTDQVLGKAEGPPVKAHGSQPWEVNNLVVPIRKPVGLPPTGLGGGRIICADYALRFSACQEFSCCGKGMVEMSVPLLIGTIPLNP